MALFGSQARMIDPSEALPGRADTLSVTPWHAVYPERRIVPPFPDGMRTAVLAMGCFWGAERVFWRTEGVHVTAVGYAGGITPNPTYHEVCSGLTGHAEAVLVVFDPAVLDYAGVLRVFWENHDPTQGLRQGNDVGSQYRSGIYYADEEQRRIAETSRANFQPALSDAGHGAITTEIAQRTEFYYAEDGHQQYLHKNPHGYCGIGGTGVSCPIGVATEAANGD